MDIKRSQIPEVQLVLDAILNRIVEPIYSILLYKKVPMPSN